MATEVTLPIAKETCGCQSGGCGCGCGCAGERVERVEDQRQDTSCC